MKIGVPANGCLGKTIHIELFKRLFIHFFSNLVPPKLVVSTDSKLKPLIIGRCKFPLTISLSLSLPICKFPYVFCVFVFLCLTYEPEEKKAVIMLEAGHKYSFQPETRSVKSQLETYVEATTVRIFIFLYIFPLLILIPFCRPYLSCASSIECMHPYQILLEKLHANHVNYIKWVPTAIPHLLDITSMHII